MRFVPAWFRPVIRRLGKLAGTSTAKALAAAIEQDALDGRKRIDVAGPQGLVATYDPEGRHGR